MPLNMFFQPKGIAIIGASRFKHKLGHTILSNFVKKFKGKVYPVNPKAKKILGLKCYASVKDIARPIDLTVIVVPAQVVSKVLKECVEKEIRGVIIISGGFAEIGPEGLKRELECKRIIAGTRTRILGPNCVGVYDPKSKVDTLFLSKERLGRPKPGSIAFISQSGAVGSTILDWLAEEGIGISKFISYGNALDVDEADLLQYLAKDKDTKVITAYLEGVKDGKRFLSAAKKVSKIKPVIILKAGKTEKGAAAAASHTGALAGAAEIYSGTFRQSGVLEAENFEQLFDFAKAFASQPLPRGPRAVIITDGGGFGVLATDEAERQGLELPKPNKKLLKLFKAKFPAYAVLENPVDLTGDATSQRYKIAIEACLKAKEYDGLIVILLLQVPTLEVKVIDVIAAASKKFKKPIICCATGGPFTKKLVKQLEAKGVPVYPTPERAVRALAAMWRYKTI